MFGANCLKALHAFFPFPNLLYLLLQLESRFSLALDMLSLVIDLGDHPFPNFTHDQQNISLNLKVFALNER